MGEDIELQRIEDRYYDHKALHFRELTNLLKLSAILLFAFSTCIWVTLRTIRNWSLDLYLRDRQACMFWFTPCLPFFNQVIIIIIIILEILSDNYPLINEQHTSTKIPKFDQANCRVPGSINVNIVVLPSA